MSPAGATRTGEADRTSSSPAAGEVHGDTADGVVKTIPGGPTPQAGRR